MGLKGLTKPSRDEVIIHVDTSSYGMTGAIRRGRWKLLLNVKREPVYDRTSDSAPLDWLADAAATYLYDVEADPSEAVDLSAANPDIVDELSKRLVDVHAHAAAPLYCAPTRDEDEKARARSARTVMYWGPGRRYRRIGPTATTTVKIEMRS